MFVQLLTITLLMLISSSVSEDTEQCCVGKCSVDGEEKFYSIDDKTNYCGEACMKPEDYDLYHKFEKNLLPANATVTPCADLNYHTYLDTVTHGFLTVKMTLDLYDF